jgi:hypothetical protein
MKNKIFVIGIGIFFLLLFSGLNIPANKLISRASISVNAVSDADNYFNSVICPFLEVKNNRSCPYLIDNSKGYDSSCPYLSGKAKCPNTGRVIQSPSCPYLNQDSKDIGNKEKNYNLIENTSI